jgi:hypothetical protein
VAKTAELALASGVPADAVHLACYANALAAYGQSGQISDSHWLDPIDIDQRESFAGNSILRGGREPVVNNAKTDQVA